MSARAALTSALNNESYTPPQIITPAREALGGDIDLDPASCSFANDVVRARYYFDEQDNGLRRLWFDEGRTVHEKEPYSCTVFLNPPGGTLDRETLQPMPRDPKTGKQRNGGVSSVAVWWFKLLREYRAGRVTSAVFLVFRVDVLQTIQQINYRDGGDFEPPHAFPFCVLRKRPKYYYRDTPPELRGKVGRPTHAAAVVFLPPRVLVKGVGGRVLAHTPDARGIERFQKAFSPHGLVRL